MKIVARVAVWQLILVGALQIPHAAAEPIGLASLFRLCFDTLNGCTDGSVVFAPDPTDFVHSGTFDTASLHVDFSGNAGAEFGEYGAAVSASFDGVNAPRTDVQFQARSLERLTVIDPLLDGQEGSLEFTYALDGTIVAPGGLFRGRFDFEQCVAPAGSLSLIGTPGTEADCELLRTQTPVDSWTVSLPFIFGTAFDWRTLFLVDAAFNGATGATGVGSVSVDYSNTVTLVGLRVFTFDGQEVLNPVFVSESNTRYSTDGVVPEPATLLLLGAGLGAVAARRRFQSRA